MDYTYADIINLRRPSHENDVFGRAHPRMPRQNRAKLFAPYAALRGFEECVEAKRVRYVPKRIPDRDEEYELNRRIALLYERCRNGYMARANRVVVRVEYFVPCSDPNHDGYRRLGQYRELTGIVQRVDLTGQCLLVEGVRVAFSDIGELTAPDSRLPPVLPAGQAIDQ